MKPTLSHKQIDAEKSKSLYQKIEAAAEASGSSFITTIEPVILAEAEAAGENVDDADVKAGVAEWSHLLLDMYLENRRMYLLRKYPNADIKKIIDDHWFDDRDVHDFIGLFVPGTPNGALTYMANAWPGCFAGSSKYVESVDDEGASVLEDLYVHRNGEHSPGFNAMSPPILDLPAEIDMQGNPLSDVAEVLAIPENETAYDKWKREAPEDYNNYMQLMAEWENDDPEPIEETYEINSMDSLEYALRIMGEAHSHLVGVEAEFNAEINRITNAHKRRIAQAQNRYNSLKYRFTWPIRVFAKDELKRRQGKRKSPDKSLATKNAILQFTNFKPGLEIVDDEAAINHAMNEGLDECLNIKTTIYKDKYKKLAMSMLENGDPLPPGAGLTQAWEKFEIKL